MRTKTILRIAILPLLAVSVLAFTVGPFQKDEKGNKGNKPQQQDSNKGNGKSGSNNGKSDRNNGNDKSNAKGNDRVDFKHRGNNENGNKQKSHGNEKSAGNKNNGKSKDYFKIKGNHRGNGNSKNLNGKRDLDINWGFNDYANRKRPKNQKKVTICHKPSTNASKSGVTISVSENALEAHRNHGDEIGNCNNYPSGWDDNYIKSRENVFSVYEQTWERMSYSEALLQLALQKLVGARTNLNRDRLQLSSTEIQRREALIYDLENNTTLLDTQLGVTRQRLDSDVNIIVQL